MELLGVFSMGDLIPSMGWVDKLTGLEAKADMVAKEFDMFLEGVLEEHFEGLNTKANGVKVAGNEKVNDFVDVLIEFMGDDTTNDLPIDKESIKALILDIFAAGTDTTFSGIEWAMSELLRHPRVLNELQQDVRRITQGKACVNEDDLENMKYLKAAIKETLRLHPPAPLLVFHESARDVKINGYDIAARTQVIINAWAIQRDPSIWEEPDDFRPERSLTSPIDFKGHDFQLIPFGAGRRICPGIQFAAINSELILANLMHGFDWALLGAAKCQTSNGITIHRQSPLLVVATPHRQE